MSMNGDGATGASPAGILGAMPGSGRSVVGMSPWARWDPALQNAVRLLNSAKMPMALMIGLKGTLVVNDATSALFSEKVGGVIINGRSVLDVLPENSAFCADVLKRVMGGQACSYPAQPIGLIRNGKPETAWFNLDFVPVADSLGTVLAVLAIASDVTHHVSHTRSLTEAVGRLRLALEGSGMVGIWTRDIQTRVSTCDANVARIFGLPVADCEQGVDDRFFIEAIHRDDRDGVVAALETAVATAQPYRCRYRVPEQGKRVRWVIASGKPAFDDDGKLSRLLGIVVDVTDQMETAVALAESRFQFQTLTEALPQIVWSCDGEGRHDYFSERWSEFTGIRREAITEETWKQLVHPQDWQMV